MTFRLPLFAHRIVETATSTAGQYAGRLLADMGAEVIKIVPDEASRRDSEFEALNRNKYGVSIDLSNERARDVLLRLIDLSDAIIQDAESPNRLNYDTVRNQSAETMLVTISSGIGISVPAAAATGTAAAGALAVALWDRRRTGRGQHVEVSAAAVRSSLAAERAPLDRRRHPAMAPHGLYPCAPNSDSREAPHVAIACPDDASFAALANVIGQPPLATDPRFTTVFSRKRNEDALDDAIAEWTRSRAALEAAETLQAAGVPASPVLDAAKLNTDPHLSARHVFEPVAHSETGVADIESPHWRMSETPAHVRLPAPAFGAHNDYVLRHLLELGDDEINTLVRRSS